MGDRARFCTHKCKFCTEAEQQRLKGTDFRYDPLLHGTWRHVIGAQRKEDGFLRAGPPCNMPYVAPCEKHR